MKVSKETMKKVVRECFEPGMFIGFLEVEGNVEVEGWHPDYFEKGVTLVVYKGYNNEIQHEILTEMYENAMQEI